MSNKRMALVSCDNIIVIPQELWSKLVSVLQLLKRDWEQNDTFLWRKLGVVGYLFNKYEKEIVNSQQLYMTAHPYGYEQWETEIVEQAILRLEDELRILCDIKNNIKRSCK